MQWLGLDVFRRPATVAVRRFNGRLWTSRGVTRADVPAERISLATYNIWCDPWHAEQRYRTIADELSHHAPDIMVFQEVTETARRVLLEQPWIRERYLSAAVTGGYVGNYGMLLLTRLPVGEVTYGGLPTERSRGYLTACYRIGGHPLTVVGIHLESGKAADQLRDQQLGEIVGSVRDADAVFLGDFNLRDAENGIIPADFRDVWPILRPDEPGYTEDTTINLMRYDMDDKHRHVRFDRVLLKGERWAPESIELLGREAIAPELPRVFPSDHFGVRATLVRS
ncbi:endonuclease/exonuclease/phosphatase family protein [Mycobacterium sp. C31M]